MDPLRLRGVERTANSILKARGERPVSTTWASRFVKRNSDLLLRMSRSYDYKRALSEDPRKLTQWFEFYSGLCAEHGIDESNVYNMDETGFMMGMITPDLVVKDASRPGSAKQIQQENREWVTVISCISGDGNAVPPFVILKGGDRVKRQHKRAVPPGWEVETSPQGRTCDEIALSWMKHFDLHTAKRADGSARLLVLDCHGSHNSDEFLAYAKNHNMVLACLPPHSSHLTQPLEVGIFQTLKLAYSKEAEQLIRNGITHVTRETFLVAFEKILSKTMTKSHIQGAFRDSGLIPCNADKGLSRIAVDSGTSVPETAEMPSSLGGSSPPWESQVPRNDKEFLKQARFRRNCGSDDFPEACNHTKAYFDEYRTWHFVCEDGLKSAQEMHMRHGEHRKRALSTSVPAVSFEEQQVHTQEAPIEQPTKRLRRCDNCSQSGHTRRTCREAPFASSLPEHTTALQAEYIAASHSEKTAALHVLHAEETAPAPPAQTSALQPKETAIPGETACLKESAETTLVELGSSPPHCFGYGLNSCGNDN